MLRSQGHCSTHKRTTSERCGGGERRGFAERGTGLGAQRESLYTSSKTTTTKMTR